MYVGSSMDYVNLKMLGVYYGVQKALNNNVASPLVRDIKPVISIVKDDFGMLTQKVLPHIKSKSSSSSKKLNVFCQKLFHKIDSGQIKPERYLGSRLTADETIDQMEIHDSFMTLYDAFFEQFQGNQVVESIRETTLNEMKKFDMRKEEFWMFKQMMISDTQRSPITFQLEGLCDVVDVMYEVSSQIHGPVRTDKFLSQAVKESIKITPKFRADNFL